MLLRAAVAALVGVVAFHGIGQITCGQRTEIVGISEDSMPVSAERVGVSNYAKNIDRMSFCLNHRNHFLCDFPGNFVCKSDWCGRSQSQALLFGPLREIVRRVGLKVGIGKFIEFSFKAETATVSWRLPIVFEFDLNPHSILRRNPADLLDMNISPQLALTASARISNLGEGKDRNEAGKKCLPDRRGTPPRFIIGGLLMGAAVGYLLLRLTGMWGDKR